jgi:hypothetical protein
VHLPIHSSIPDKQTTHHLIDHELQGFGALKLLPLRVPRLLPLVPLQLLPEARLLFFVGTMSFIAQSNTRTIFKPHLNPHTHKPTHLLL